MFFKFLQAITLLMYGSQSMRIAMLTIPLSHARDHPIYIHVSFTNMKILKEDYYCSEWTNKWNWGYMQLCWPRPQKLVLRNSRNFSTMNRALLKRL